MLSEKKKKKTKKNRAEEERKETQDKKEKGQECRNAKFTSGLKLKTMNRKTKHVARFLFTWVSNILLKATLNIFGTKIKCHMDNTHCEKLVLAITHWYYQSILYIGDKLCVLFLSCRSLFQPKNTPSCSDIMPTQSFEVQPVWAMGNRDIVWENLPVKLFPDF